MSAGRTWPESLRASAYEALGAGRIIEWAADQGVSVQAARAVAGAYRRALELPRHKPMPADLTDAQLMRGAAAVVAERCGVSAALVCAERHRRGLVRPDARAALMAAPLDELARDSADALCRRYHCSHSTVSEVRRLRGVTATPGLLPQREPAGATERQRATEAEEIAEPPAVLRVGPRFSVDPRAYDTGKLTFDPNAEPDPKWEARFMVREPHRLGVWGESV